MPMSAIQCWPQLFGHPVTWSFRCSSKPGNRSSSSSTRARANPFVSVRASLQNSEPVHATVPRQKGEASSRSPAASRSEEHTSELQSRGHLVCRLLLEKKKILFTHAHRMSLTSQHC